MKILAFLDKLFDLTSHVESTIDSVSKKTERYVRKIVASVVRSAVNLFILLISIAFVVIGLMLFLSRYAPIE